MSKNNWLLFSTLSLASVGCFHDEELKKEVFAVNTRVLALENELQDKQATNSRQYVSASSKVSQMQEDLLKIKGEIDKLHIGIQKGEMPGTSPNEHEPSIAKQLAALSEKLKMHDVEKLDERITALEKAQNEILTLLEKIDKKKGNKAEKRDKLSSAKAIEHAFEKKRFSDIVEDAPHFIENKHHRKEDINHARYFYSESLFKLGRMREAALSFGELLKKESGSEIGAKIRMRMGDCFRNLGDKKTALAYYKLLVEKYPHSSESEYAKKHIKKLEEHPT